MVLFPKETEVYVYKVTVFEEIIIVIQFQYHHVPGSVLSTFMHSFSCVPHNSRIRLLALGLLFTWLLLAEAPSYTSACLSSTPPL